MHYGFASDNYAGAHPKVIEAIARASEGYALAYGADPLTERARQKLARDFGGEAEIFFVFNGTGANVLGLKSILSPHHAVLCAKSAHIQNDECGAPEASIGCKLWTLETADGKLTPEILRTVLPAPTDSHRVQPKAISISQVTELGTLYTASEIRALASLAHEHGLYLHVDGARLANAAAALDVSLAEMTRDAGVDVLSLGATKNGALGAEAVVFFRPELARDFEYRRKQGLQLASKMRFLAAQFDALWEAGLWLELARHANRMAKRLEARVRALPQLQLVYPVEANALFVRLPAEARRQLAEDYYFYDWDAATGDVRWMTSFQTTESEIDRFADRLESVLGGPNLKKQ